MASRAEIEAALDVLDKASAENMQPVKSRVLATFKIVQKRLITTEEKIAPIIGTIAKNRSYIDKLLEGPVKDAIGTPAQFQQDGRLNDLRALKGNHATSCEAKYRGLLATRSFGLQFCDWQRKNGLPDRVSELVADLRNCRRKSGDVVDFQHEQGFDGDDLSLTKNAIADGIKILFIEESYGYPGISVLLTSVLRAIRDLRYQQLPTFIAALQNDEFVSRKASAPKTTDRLHESQRNYAGK
jgi:hypothetical protein